MSAGGGGGRECVCVWGGGGLFYYLHKFVCTDVQYFVMGRKTRLGLDRFGRSW